jgi:transcriptional regulator with XRE-family HTH domain
MSQNNISRLENPEYGKHTISSLKRIAEALDVALVVRLVPFSQYIEWVSGTPNLDKGISPEALAVPSFEDEERAGTFSLRRAGSRRQNLDPARQPLTNRVKLWL